MPKTKEEDLRSFLKERNILQRERTQGRLSNQQFSLERMLLAEKYGGKVFPEDEYQFLTFEEFEDFYDQLIKSDLVPSKEEHTRKRLDRSLEHEKAHAETAISRGYTVIYGCFLFIPTNPTITINEKEYSASFGKVAFTAIKERMSNKDGIDILSAPKEPSPMDIEDYNNST